MRSGLEVMQQALKMYQQSTDAVSEDVSVSKRMVEDRNIKHVSMLVTMSQMLQDIGNLEEARGHLEDALQRLRQSLLSHNLLEAKTLCTLGTVFHKLATQTTTEHGPFVARLYTWYYKYKAHNLLTTALNIMRKARNAHPNTATILAAIGRLDLDSGDLYSAISFIWRRLMILKQNAVDLFIQTLLSITSCWQRLLVRLEMNALPSLTHKKLTRSREP